jgi:acyl-CoA reductase-like NAD-dependent aldehyde dehydrogenase
MDAALAILRDRSLALSVLGRQRFVGQLVRLLDRCIASVRQNAEEWVRVSCEAKHIQDDWPISGEEWLAGPVVTIRNLRLLRETLTRYAETGEILPGKGVRPTAHGTLAVDVFPTSLYDAMLFSGFSAKVHLLPGVTSDMAETASTDIYFDRRRHSGVSLVLGAGNVSSIPPMDALYKIFAHGHTCIVKMNPVNDYLTPVFLKAFAPLIEDGLLRFVTGGAEEGAYLTQHRDVTDVHITGSNRTHDAIVWGIGPMRQDRKRLNAPLLQKPITSELGNISPVMIVPGAYTDVELKSVAWNVATQIVNNGSFNCNAAKMLVLAKGWPQREAFLDHLRKCLYSRGPRYAYYPGARSRHEELTRFGTSVEVLEFIGDDIDDAARADYLPWTIVTADAADRSNPLFSTEPFCAMITVTELDGPSAETFLPAAVAFCNDTLWGTLNACILIDPRTEKAHAAALDAAVHALRYGTVGINHWPALGYGFVSTPWGGHPSSTLADIRSGLGWVHNTYLLPDHLIEKTVIRGPLVVKPKPAWFAHNAMTHVIGRKLVDFEAAPSLLKLPGIIKAALRG